jgi:haloalkane dehalogenase
MSASRSTNMSPHSYREHRIAHQGATLYAREFTGGDPALLLMHGFPDNLHIYDRLVPLLAGRRVVAFDFLGWGASDKPRDNAYTSRSQQDDLGAVLDALGVEHAILVPHDASGPVAINWALDHPTRVAGLALLNTYYGSTPTVRFPEFISLFADPAYAALTTAIAQDPAIAGWLLNWQGQQFGGAADPAGADELGAIIQAQFAASPSVFPAFMSHTRDLYPAVRANSRREAQVRAWTLPVRIIFGAGDPYLGPAVANYFTTIVPTAERYLLQAGHWPQWDAPEEVAHLLLTFLAPSSGSHGN